LTLTYKLQTPRRKREKGIIGEENKKGVGDLETAE
jgi:hypothetical protein